MIENQKDELHKKNLKNLFVLFGAILLGEIKMIRQMLDEGVNINSRLQDVSPTEIELNPNVATISASDTPLLIALKHNSDFEVVKLLLEYGADTALPDQNGKTAMDIASEKKLIEILRLFNNNNEFSQ